MSMEATSSWTGVRSRGAAVTVRNNPRRRPASVSPASRRVLWVLAVFFVLLFVGMAQVWVRLRIVRLGYELSAEAGRTAKLERMLRALQVEDALLRDPKRIQRLAKDRFELRPPKPSEVHEILVPRVLEVPSAGGDR